MRLNKSILVLMLTIALLAVSCATQKKAAREIKTEAQSSVLQQKWKAIDFDVISAAATERIMKEYFRRLRESTTTTDKVTERITEIFDTTQPTDSSTGLPPLLSRTTERNEARQKSEIREKTEAAGAECEAQTRSDVGKLNENVSAASLEEDAIENESMDREEKHCGSIAGWICISFSLLVMAAVVVAVFIKTRLNNH